MSRFGYAGEMIKVDLSRGNTCRLFTADYADRFLGGRGIAAKIYWDEVSPEISAFDPANHLIFITGPLAGFTRLAGSRWQVCGKSPAMGPEVFSYGNIGGSWGSWLKFAGYDGMVIHGKSKKPVYLFIHDGTVEIRDASFLWGKTAVEVRQILKAELGKEVRVLATGPAGENLVSFATLLSDDDATASSGFGSVMGSKNLKAIAVVGNNRPKAANPGKVRELADHILCLRKGTWKVYTPGIAGRTKTRACYGCIAGCIREVYKAESGEQFKFFCQAVDVYRRPALKYYGNWNEVIADAVGLCNSYSLDTAVLQPMIEWLAKCFQAGVLGEQETGIPLSKIGSSEFIETLVRKISYREGFGDVLAQGTLKAAELIGKGAKELIGDSISTAANELTDYDPRIYITTGLLLATEPRRPIQQLHEISLPILQWLEWLKGGENAFLSTEVFRAIAEKFWGSRLAVDFSTYEGKATAAKKIQDRAYAKECLILCDWLWPILWIRNSENHMGDTTLESQVLSAVTGRDINEDQLNMIGERVLNLQRAILLREGWGGRKGDRLLDFHHEIPVQYGRFNRDCQVPGRDGETISRKGAVVEREEFEKMKSELYELRGWDVESGLQTKVKLQELGLGDVANDLIKNGLLK